MKIREWLREFRYRFVMVDPGDMHAIDKEVLIEDDKRSRYPVSEVLNLAMLEILSRELRSSSVQTVELHI
jgi:hypothetical protein